MKGVRQPASRTKAKTAKTGVSSKRRRVPPRSVVRSPVSAKSAAREILAYAADTRALERTIATERAALALGVAISDLPVVNPERARSIQATVNLIRSVDEKYGLLSATEVGQLLGSESASARNLAGSRHRAGELIALESRGGRKYPGYQFVDGRPRRVIAELRGLADENGWSEYDLFLWMVTPSTRFAGRAAADLLGTPGGDEKVREVTALEMQTEW